MSSPQPQNWHRYHYPVGFFLVVFGATGLLGTVLRWSAHRDQIATYLTRTAGLGKGLDTPVLIGLHVIEGLLVLIALAGVLRRRDVWFLPALLGWIGGFAVFCVLDLWAGTFGMLAEHAGFLAVFILVLFISYALGVKARVGRPPAGPGLTPRNLTRTQEFALAALNRWQQGAPQGPLQVPPPSWGPPPGGPQMQGWSAPRP
jgi:hypothetical protein